MTTLYHEQNLDAWFTTLEQQEARMPQILDELAGLEETAVDELDEYVFIDEDEQIELITDAVPADFTFDPNAFCDHVIHVKTKKLVSYDLYNERFAADFEDAEASVNADC